MLGLLPFVRTQFCAYAFLLVRKGMYSPVAANRWRADRQRADVSSGHLGFS
jgi:hypothetical protein